MTTGSAFAQAVTAHQGGDLQQAEQLYLQVLAGTPAHLMASHNLALILAQTGRAREAERRLERLVKTAPNDASAHLLLGRLLGQMGRATRSLFLLRRAVALASQRPDIWLDTIAALGEQGRTAEVDLIATQALQALPAEPALAVQAGLAWMHAGQDPRAQTWFETALAIDPAYAPALYHLATIHEAEGTMAVALALFRKARACDPDGSLPPVCLGDLELRMGDVARAIASVDAWLPDHPADPVAISNRLMAAQYAPGVTAWSLLPLHGLWQERIGAKISPLPPRPALPEAPAQALRVGLVSGDLYVHAVGCTTIPAIEGLDPTAIHLTIYSDAVTQDAVSARFRAKAAVWRQTAGWSDAQLAVAVREDRIDVLIDMSGHTTNIRLGAFARCPAPVQLSWAGYFGTIGCAAINGLIVDQHLVPDGEEAAYTEAVLRLPDGYLCYDPPGDAPAVPVRAPGPIQLAAFHNPAKINADVVALWARVLQTPELDGAVLHFTYRHYDVPELQERILAWFTAQGIGPGRVTFTGMLSRVSYFDRLGHMDIGLDPFPFSGGATTCDALWMGVPVVTLPGRTVAGRHSQSHLHAAGHSEWVARDADDYVAIVTKLARDRARLAAIQAELRAGVAGSALCDGARFGRNLQALLQKAWRDR